MRLESLKGKQQLPDTLTKILILFFTLFYLLTIDNAGFWLDEVWSINDLKKPYLQMIEARATAGHGPLYFSIAWLWLHLVGDTEWPMRLPALLAWLGIIVFSTLLIRKKIGPWGTVFTVLLLSLSPSLFYLAQLVRPYTLSILLILINITWMLHIEDRPRLRDSLILAAISALAINTHASTAIPLIGQIIYLLARRKPHWNLSFAIGFGLLAILPLLLHLFEHRSWTNSPISWLQHAVFLDLLKLPTAILLGKTSNELTLPTYWPALSILLSILTIWGGIQSGRLGRVLLIIWGFTILVVTVITLINGPAIGTLIRYFGTITVAQIILMNFAIFGQRKFRIAILWSTAFPLALLLAWHLFISLNSHRHPDWRTALAYVQEHRQGKQQLHVLADSFEMLIYEHYYEKLQMHSQASLVKNQEINQEVLTLDLRDITNNTKYLWIIFGEGLMNYYSHDDIRIKLLHSLQRNHSLRSQSIQLTEDLTIGNITILRYRLNLAEKEPT